MDLQVHVSPKARRESVEEKGETLIISVREPAEHNRANTRVREIVAKRFRLPVGKVRILSGHRSRSKMLSIDT